MNDKIKLLYVDDEELNLQVFEITFSFKFEVITAISAKEGLEIIADNPGIQFIISDMKMPEVTGLEFITKLKKTNPSIPCMILSGYDETPEVLQALNDNLIVSYMIKPLNKVHIEELISKHVAD